MTIPIYRIVEVTVYSILNIIPFLLLAIYPFRRHLRFSYVATNLTVVGIMLIQIGINYVTAFLAVTSEIMSLVTIVMYAGFYFLVIKDQLGRLSFMLLIFTNIGNLVTVCAKCMEGLLFGSIALEPFRWSIIVCELIVDLLVMVPVVLYERKYFNSNTPIHAKAWNYLWIIPATFYLIWYYHLYFSGRDSRLVALDVHHALFLLLINMGAFVVYHTAILLLFEQEKSSQLAQNNYLLSLRNVQHENLQQRINEARRAKHDVHHHIHLIQEYLRSGKLQELEAYLDRYSASLPSSQSVVYCQHYETNTLLGYFAQQAQQAGIKMDVFMQFPEKIGLPETVLSVLLGNLLENAIDACQEIPTGERKITVRGKAGSGFVYFCISNSYAGKLKKNMAGEYVSTKTKGQGLGLTSVAQLVRYHGGVLEVEAKDQVFQVSVMLQEQREK